MRFRIWPRYALAVSYTYGISVHNLVGGTGARAASDSRVLNPEDSCRSSGHGRLDAGRCVLLYMPIWRVCALRSPISDIR